MRGSYDQTSSPVPASRAATCPRAVLTYTSPPIISGAVLNGPGRMASRSAATSPEIERHRQAISSSVKFSGVIWSSGEYLVLAPSAPNARHSPGGAGG